MSPEARHASNALHLHARTSRVWLYHCVFAYQTSVKISEQKSRGRKGTGAPVSLIICSTAHCTERSSSASPFARKSVHARAFHSVLRLSDMCTPVKRADLASETRHASLRTIGVIDSN
jgi:hypothetical protein